ncbi:hypothetical protein Tco_0281048 [Tanacetum coccineum]
MPTRSVPSLPLRPTTTAVTNDTTHQSPTAKQPATKPTSSHRHPLISRHQPSPLNPPPASPRHPHRGSATTPQLTPP